VQTIEVFKIEETSDDHLLLRNNAGAVRIRFADGYVGTKEESAHFFRGLEGKPAAIPTDGPFFIGVDFWCDQLSGELKTVPFPFEVASVERLG
jgi:hypothetical protein